MDKRHTKGTDAVSGYLHFKYSSGLLDYLSWNFLSWHPEVFGVRYTFQVTWGVYHQLILPELKRLYSEYNLAFYRRYMLYDHKNKRWNSPLTECATAPLGAMVETTLYVGGTRFVERVVQRDGPEV